MLDIIIKELEGLSERYVGYDNHDRLAYERAISDAIDVLKEYNVG